MSVGWARGISPLSVSVYGSNKTGTTHSFCVGYSGGACRGRGRRGALVVVIGHQVLYPCRREMETGGSEGTVKRYWDTACFTKILWRLPGILLREKCRLIKMNTRTENERAGERVREGEKERKRRNAREESLSFYSPAAALFFFL